MLALLARICLRVNLSLTVLADAVRFAFIAIKLPADLNASECSWSLNIDPNTKVQCTAAWFQNCSAEFWQVASISDCKEDLFAGSSTVNPHALVYHQSAPLLCQFAASGTSVYAATVAPLYFAALGQGIINSSITQDLAMEWTHVIALAFACVATAGVMCMLSVALAEYETVDVCGPVLYSGVLWSGSSITGIALVLWKKALMSAFTGNTSKQESREYSHIVFGSMRFPPTREAYELQHALAERGIELMIIDMMAGGDIDVAVFEGIERCDCFLAFGTSHYGEDTGNQAVRSTSVLLCASSLQIKAVVTHNMRDPAWLVSPFRVRFTNLNLQWIDTNTSFCYE